MAILNKIKKKVVDVASDVMSAPARISASRSIAKSDRVYKDAVTVKQNKGKPDAGDYTDPLFRARINNLHDKADAKIKAEKLAIAKKVDKKPSSYENDYAEMRSGKKIPYRNDLQRYGGYDKLLKK